MAKILMINPVVREEDKPKHIPYGLALLAQIALDKGHKIQFYDENAWRKGKKVKKQVINADNWDVIAIGTSGETGLLQPAHDLYSGLQEECSARLAGDCPAGIGLNRALATTKTWTNGTGGDDTKIEMKNTFTSTGVASITESGLFNSTSIATGGMLAHQTFTAVSLTSGDSITVTWTFTVGD